MTKQEFLDSFTEWMTEMAEKIFPDEGLFTEKELTVPEKPIIQDYQPRGELVRTSNIAKHYGITLQKLRVELETLSIKETSDRKRYTSITYDDCVELVKYIKRKYNNFNE